VGHAHLKKGNGFVEPRIFSIMLAGSKHPEHYSQKPVDWDFFDLKGMLEELFTILGFGGITVKKSELSMLHPGRQAKVYVGDVHVGIMGEIHPELLVKLDIPQRVLFAECDMQELLNINRSATKMQELAIFPSSERDWTITLSKSVKFAELMAKIDELKPAICQEVSLTSIFEHEKLGLDKHNLTLHFVYRDRAKTISQDEVDKAHQTVVSGALNYLAEKYPE
jgi:phenylalanyl-tRNA synthetase beta chain